MKLIPAIDLIDGHCVRLHQGKFNKVTHYDLGPVELAKKYQATGFTNLHIVDLDGTKDGCSENADVIKEIIETSGLNVQLGGGIRSLDDIVKWLDIGVFQTISGSYAIVNIGRLEDAFKNVELSRIIIALDILYEGGEPMVMTHGWQQSSGQSLFQLLKIFKDNGFQNFLITDISKDGTLSGPNMNLYRQCVEFSESLKFIASGGLSSMSDVVELESIGLYSAVTGKALLDKKIKTQEVKQFLQEE